MKCSKCGKESSDYVSFCESCGSILSAELSSRETETPGMAATADTPTTQAKAEPLAQEPDVAQYYDLLTKKMSGIRIAADKVQLIEKSR